MNKGLPHLHRKYARKYKEWGDLEMAGKIWLALCERSNVRGVDFTNLWDFLDEIPLNKRPEIPPEFHLAAVQKRYIP